MLLRICHKAYIYIYIILYIMASLHYNYGVWIGMYCSACDQQLVNPMTPEEVRHPWVEWRVKSAINIPEIT